MTTNLTRNSTTTQQPNDPTMTSKMKSRWADDEEDAAAEAARKREKEEKKRAKAEKQRKADALLQQQQQAASAGATEPEPTQTELSNRPSKRRKLSPEPEVEDVGDKGEVKLLRFPTTGWKKCRSVEEYEKLNDIEEGAYGWVSRAKDTATGQVVALKRLKMDNANDGIPVTGLREIQTLMDCEHPNIVALREVVVGEDTRKIEKYVLYSFPFPLPMPPRMVSNLDTQHLPRPRLPRTRPQNPPRRNGRALSNVRDQDPPPTARLGHPLPTQHLDPTPGPENLQSPPQQPGSPEDRRFWHGTLLRRPATENDTAGRDTLVQGP